MTRTIATMMVLAAAACGGVVFDEPDAPDVADGDGRDGHGDADVPDVPDVPADDSTAADDAEEIVEDVPVETDADGEAGCTGPDECDDLNVCNGTETCSYDGTCVPGEPPIDGTECTTADGATGACRSHLCVPPGCGDGTRTDPEECDDGNTRAGDGCERDCRFTCHAGTEETDCADDDPCTKGVCIVGGTGRICDQQPESDVPCDRDGDLCTQDICDAGHCVAGDLVNCEDGNPCTDNFCVSATGECGSSSIPRWFLDADGDTWGDANESQCSNIMPEGWVARPGDCCDSNTTVNPDQTGFFGEPYRCGDATTPSFDWNCSGVEERQYPHTATPCSWSGASCSGSPGWSSVDDGTVSACVGVAPCGMSCVWQSACSGSGSTDAGTDGAATDGGSADAGSDVIYPDGVVGDTATDGGDVPPDVSTDGSLCSPTLESRRQPCR